jgi:hypothetical protein
MLSTYWFPVVSCCLYIKTGLLRILLSLLKFRTDEPEGSVKFTNISKLLAHFIDSVLLSRRTSPAATFRQKILNIAKAETESMIKPDRMADDFGRKTISVILGFCLIHAISLADWTLS